MVNLGLFRHSDTVPFPAGHTLFSVGDKGDKMYVVIEGEIEVVVGTTIVEVATPGAILGEMALIDSSPRSATAIAKTDCRVVEIDPRRFQFLIQQTPFFAIQVMEIMANRLRHTNKILIS